MRTIKTDSNGDFVYLNGEIQIIYDLDAVMQTCEQRMRQQLAELDYDQQVGIEYFNNVFLGNPNLQMFEAQARAQLLTVDDVKKIQYLNYSTENGALNYEALIITKYGSGVISGSI